MARAPGSETEIGEPGKLARYFPLAGSGIVPTRIIDVDLGGVDEDYCCYLEGVDLVFRLSFSWTSERSMSRPGCRGPPVCGSATTGGRHGGFSFTTGHQQFNMDFLKTMPRGFVIGYLLPLHFLLNFAFRHQIHNSSSRKDHTSSPTRDASGNAA